MVKRKRKLGDRPEGRKLRTIPPLVRMMPFIMRERSDSLNMFSDSIEIEEAEKYIKEKREQGYENFGLLHLFIAAYIRTVSQRPAINRFVSGQLIYQRNSVDVSMAIKREMNTNSPETCIKMTFDRDVTPIEVYEAICGKIEKYKDKKEENNVSKAAKLLNYIPRGLLKFAMFVLRTLDYWGLLPKSIINLSPFHASLFITSMGSLGIPPIYHHIYNFGNVPVFLAFGKRRRVNEINNIGKTEQKIYSDICVVTDERICDGFYYASAFKMLQRIMRNPYRLDEKPKEIIEDID